MHDFSNLCDFMYIVQVLIYFTSTHLLYCIKPTAFHRIRRHLLNWKNVTSPIPGGGGGGKSSNYGQLFFWPLPYLPSPPPSLHGNIEQGRTHPRTSLVHLSSMVRDSPMCAFSYIITLIWYAMRALKSICNVFFGRFGQKIRAADEIIVLKRYFMTSLFTN